MAGPGGTINLTNGDDTFPLLGLDDNSGDETVNGLDGNDTISGGIGADKLNGDNGDDTLNGEAGDDILAGGIGNDTITDSQGAAVSIDGGADNDTIIVTSSSFSSGSIAGGSGTDILRAGSANLRFASLTGLEFLHTGGGVVTATAAQFDLFNTICDTDANPAGQVSLIIAAVGAAQTADLSDELNSGGGPRRVILTGSSDDETITIGGGDDEINGNNGNDTLSGGDGNDTLSGGQSNDTLNGGNGNDTIVDFQGTTVAIDGGANDDFVDIVGTFFTSGSLAGGTGTDTLASGNANLSVLTVSGFEFLHTGGGVARATAAQFGAFGSIRIDAASTSATVNLTIMSTGAAQSVDLSGALKTGGERALILIGSSDADTVTAGNLDDQMFGGGSNDTLNGGDGSDQLFGESGDDTLNGGDGNDRLLGESNNDTLNGGNGDDLLIGSTGNDTYNGGIGSDTADMSGGSGVFVTLDATGGGVFTNGGLGTDTFVSIENVFGSNTNDELTGNGFDNLFRGRSGDDTLDGAGGSDTADYSEAGSGVTVNLGLAGPQLIGAGEGSDTLISIENVIGSAQGDTLTGNGSVNIIDGGLGNDTMAGLGGNDTYFDNLGDTISEALNAGYDTVNSTRTSYTLGANLERVNFIGSGNFVGTGNALSNRFQAGSGDDRIVDILGGADIFSGGAGTDTVDFRTSATGAILDFTTNIHGGAAAGDSYSSIEKFLGSNTDTDTMTAGGVGRVIYAGFGGDDTLTGGIKNDQLLGGAGNDILSGGADRDSLDGGTGNDTMTGGTQGDVFVFVDAAFGQDTITDYQDGIDSFKIFSAVATSLADFTVTNNGTASVTLTLTSAPANFITINGAAPITIAADDFVFY